ncbi:MAG: DNA polymerase/3'-5' exonuclease PolX [Deltaproteobacteria bacterium]|nr:DNA polymerase/3'-5' exonuclease PolX [Deltaproteobacteria bacterium]
MNRHEIAAIFAELAAILEIKGENPFKVRAYETAARVIDGLTHFDTLFAKGELTTIKGIGKNLDAHIAELMTTGTLKEYEALRAKVPAGLLEVLRIPGVGAKKAKLLWEKLHIRDLGSLELACRGHRVAKLPGMGERTEEKILQGIQYVRAQQGRHLFPFAAQAAAEVEAALREHPAVIRLMICGSLRRKKEIVKDIDCVASSKHPADVMEAFVTLPMALRVIAKGDTKSTILLTTGIQCDLRVVTDAEFPFAIHHFTGSKAHNVAMRSRAIAKGMKLSEYGLFKTSKGGERLVPCKDEAAIFAALGLTDIPPELREDMGEIDAAAQGTLPDLVEERDLQGVFHCHTQYSDGTASLEEMVTGAMRAGFKYIGISDHSQSAGYAGGLKPPAIKQQHREIDALQKRLPSIRIFKGIESDILADGRLDYADAVLQTFDFVIASIHARLSLSAEEMTRRMCTAIAHPATTILAHPTGRLLLARDAYPVDLPAVIDAAARRGVAIEINANPHRLDMDWRHGPYAKGRGLKTMINPDAHSVRGIEDMRYGVGIARKGWWTKDEVVNTWPVEKVERWLRVS